MVEKERYIGTGIDQDTAPDKRQQDTYWDAQNIRIINNGRNISIKPINDEEVFGTFPDTGNIKNLIGKIEIQEYLYVFLTDNEAAPNLTSNDYIYRVDILGNIDPVTSGNFSFSTLNPIEALGNYENEKIIKIYWVDGYNQLRVINVADHDDNLLPLSFTGEELDIVNPIDYVKPEVIIQTGGSLIAGKVQYGYSLFNLNGSQTKISPLSTLISVSQDGEGGESGEVMNLSVQVDITGLDTSFEYIRLYSIHYQELNQTPKISLIVEEVISSSTYFFIDDGNAFIAELGTDEFALLGGDPVYPNTLSSKFNHLFIANYKSTAFDIPNNIDTDCRVFGYGEIVGENPQEDWSNELTNPLLPADVTNTPIATYPESYTFNNDNTDILSPLSAFTNRDYARIGGTQIGVAWPSVSENVVGDGTAEDIAALTNGGAGTYSFTINVDASGSGGDPLGEVELALGTSASGPWTEVLYSSGVLHGATSNTIYVTKYTSMAATHVRLYVACSNADWAVAGSTEDEYKLQTWYELSNVAILDPIDDDPWKDYDISDVRWEDDTDTPLDIGGSLYQPDDVIFNAATKLVDFIFHSDPGILVPDTTYSGDVILYTEGVLGDDGSRTHIEDRTDIAITVDLTSSPVGYSEYTVEDADVSGNADFVGESYDHLISGASFDPGTEIITINCDDITLSGSIPAGNYPNGFDVDVFTSNGTKTPEDSLDYRIVIQPVEGPPDAPYALPSDIALTHDAVNADYDVYNLQSDGVTVGYEGTNFTLEFNKTDRVSNEEDQEEILSLKQREIYRIGVIFYNDLGQRSPAKWMCDIKIPSYSNTFGVVGVTIALKSGRSSYFTGAVNYQIVCVERKSWDRTIISQGFIVPAVSYEDASPYYYPHFITKDIQDASGAPGNIDEGYQLNVDWTGVSNRQPVKHDDIQFFYSSDTLFENNITAASKIRILGTSNILDKGYRVSKIVNNIPEGIYLNNTDYLTDGFSTTSLGGDYPDNLIEESSYALGADVIKYEYIGLRKYHYCSLYPRTLNLDETLLDDGSGNSEAFVERDASTVFDSSPVAGADTNPAQLLVTDLGNSVRVEYRIEELNTNNDIGENMPVLIRILNSITEIWTSGVTLDYVIAGSLADTGWINLGSVGNLTAFDRLEVDMAPEVGWTNARLKLSMRVYDEGTVTGLNLEEIELAEPSKFLRSLETSVINNIAVSNYAYLPELIPDPSGSGSNNSGMINGYPSSVVLRFSDDIWHQYGANLWDKFIDRVTGGFERELPIIELIQDLPNQYGGFSYEAKQRNEYLVLGYLRPMASGGDSKIHYIGDIYIGHLNINRSNGGADNTDRQWNLYELIGAGVLENNHNVYSRNDELSTWIDDLSTNVEYKNYTLENNTQLLSAYNQKANLISYFPKPTTFEEVPRYPNRVMASATKYPGEVIDSWTNFLLNEVKDMEGLYGSITSLYNLKGEILVFQDEAVAQLGIQPRVQTVGEDGFSIYLGTGNLFHDHKYITTKFGTTNKFSIVDDGNILMYHDTLQNSINSLDGQKISTVLGVRNILQDNVGVPMIDSIHDKQNDEFLFNFNSYSLAYSLISKKFFSKQTFITSKGLASLENKMLLINGVVDTIHELYTNANVKSSEITYIFAPRPLNEKVFHNLEYRLYGTEFSQIEVTDVRNTSGVQTVVAKNKFDIHRIHIPRFEDTRERFRGIYILTRLLNTGDYSLDDMTVMFNLKG